MNTIPTTITAPWHRQSYLRFINEYLPALLDERLPLGRYEATRLNPENWQLTIGLNKASGAVQVVFTIPDCDEHGVFYIHRRARVVVPVATASRLDEGEILCVGEQLARILDPRIAPAPSGLAWDAELLAHWLSLDQRIESFLSGQSNRDVEALFGWGTVQSLDQQNCLARITHLRRIVVPQRRRTADTNPSSLVDSSELNRTCPFETPESHACAKVLSIARGAVIRDRKLIIVDSSYAGKLGVNAATIPCFNHTDANRLLMGVNMQRQWVPLPDPEPALVQTGLEPVAPGFWCGRNLLTAYMSVGAATFEDGIVLSTSAAARLSPEQPVEVGDKLANRHGQKGVISLILPDQQMPHTPDGRPVDIIFSFLGLQSRMSFGQLREGLLGLLARAQGQPVVVPPFAGPTDEEIQERLRSAGLPEDGMQQLRNGRGGRPFDRTTFVGSVYWGLTVHRAKAGLNLKPQTASHVQYLVLRELHACATILELYHPHSADNSAAVTLFGRLTRGLVDQASPTTPLCARLQQSLNAAGISLQIDIGRAIFAIRQPTSDDLPLAVPVPHPWLPEHSLKFIGHAPADIVEANTAVQQMLGASPPVRLLQRATATLQAKVNDHFARLLAHDALRMEGRPLFAARAVIAPSDTLTQYQCGIPDAIAWKLFGPMVEGEVGADAVRNRSPEAAAALDQTMASHWVLLVREPAVMPTSIIAFHPVRRIENVIRLHPLCCAMLNADHDGDQVTLYLPVTAAGQAEAGEKLTCAAHLRRDPSNIRWMIPRLDPLFGLAWLSRTAAGRQQISAIAGTDCTTGHNFITLASLRDAMTTHLAQHGPDRTLDVCHHLMLLGLATIASSGCSLNPFAHRAMPAVPPTDTIAPAHPQPTTEAAIDQVISSADYDTHPFGPQLFAIKSGARGNTTQLAFGLICRTIIDYDRKLHYFASNTLGGLTPEACFMSYIGARLGIAQCSVNPTGQMRQAYGVPEPSAPQGFGVLARAMRSLSPGSIFARAALANETDPLTDPDSRLFIGLPTP